LTYQPFDATEMTTETPPLCAGPLRASPLRASPLCVGPLCVGPLHAGLDLLWSLRPGKQTETDIKPRIIRKLILVDPKDLVTLTGPNPLPPLLEPDRLVGPVEKDKKRDRWQHVSLPILKLIDPTKPSDFFHRNLNLPPSPFPSACTCGHRQKVRRISPSKISAYSPNWSIGENERPFSPKVSPIPLPSDALFGQEIVKVKIRRLGPDTWI